MSFGITVKGGTGAGRKKPLRDKPKPWVHDCSVPFPDAPDSTGAPVGLPGYYARCPICSAERDGGR